MATNILGFSAVTKAKERLGQRDLFIGHNETYIDQSYVYRETITSRVEKVTSSGQ